MADIISIGKILRDIIVTTSEAKLVDSAGKKMLQFPYKEKINVEKIYSGLGGGAANTSLALARLGKKPAVLACVGNDPEGDEALNLLRMRFVETEMISRVEEETGVSIILTSPERQDKDYTGLIYQGANKFLNAETETPFEKINSASGWYISALGDGGLGLLDKLFGQKPESIKVAFNPGAIQIKLGMSALAKYLAKVDILILNQAEAALLSGKSPEESFEVLKKAGPSVVVITEGKSGAKVFDGEALYHGPAYETNVVEELGAGDAFGATFFAIALETKDIEKALKYALVNSAAALEKQGASEGLLSKEEIEERLQKSDLQIIKKVVSE